MSEIYLLSRAGNIKDIIYKTSTGKAINKIHNEEKKNENIQIFNGMKKKKKKNLFILTKINVK